MGMFEIDDEGWKKQNRGRSMFELSREAIQNALDTGSNIIVKIDKRSNKIQVVDTGPGFEQLSHAWTVYGGTKSDNPEMRGRFNRGLKELIAGCETFKLYTTCGGVEFDVNANERTEVDRSTQEGTKIIAHNSEWTTEDFNEFREYVYKLWAPEGQKILISVNGGSLTTIEREEPEWTATMYLPTVVYEDGKKEELNRNTRVHIKRTRKGDGRIYEMGIPVNMDEDFPFWIDVQQRVPLAEQRNEVNRRFLKKVLTKTVNVVYEDLSKSEMKSDWFGEVLGNFSVSKDVKEHYVSEVLEDGRKKGLVIKSGNGFVNDKVENNGYQVFDVSRASRSVADAVRDVRPSAESKVAEIHNRREQQVEPTPGEEETIRKAEEIAEQLGYHTVEFEMWELGPGSDGSQNKADHQSDGTIRLNRESSVDWGEFGASQFGTIVHEISHENGTGHDKGWYTAMQNNFARLAKEYGMLDQI